MKKGIAFFDFDGTITVKDTLLEFIKFSRGHWRFYLGFLWNLPYLVAYKIKLIANQRAKEKVLEFFFKGTPEAQFQEYCEDFATHVLPSLIRPKALQEIETLKKDGWAVVVVSASPEAWIKGWGSRHQVEIIASQLEVLDGVLTGKILGKNCHGDEKVRRILEKYVITDYDVIHAYGDTKGDLPMLQLATKSFYKPFL